MVNDTHTRRRISEEGTGWGHSLPKSLLAVPIVTAHPSISSVPVTVLMYNGPLLCDFNVPIKGSQESVSNKIVPLIAAVIWYCEIG